MKKQYIKITEETFGENMKSVGVKKENTITSLLADEGKMIRSKITGITCTRVDISPDDSEQNYEEI